MYGSVWRWKVIVINSVSGHYKVNITNDAPTTRPFS